MNDATWDFIDGHFCAASTPDGEIGREDPADLDRVLPPFGWAIAQAQSAVLAARKAQPAWGRVEQPERAKVLKRYQNELRAHRDAIAQTICDEVGKPLWEARAEADAMAAKVDLCLGPGAAYTATEDVPALPGQIRHRPLGVISVIGPFNFPGHLPNGQIVPALLTGNAVIHKPSDRTPGCARWIATCLQRAGLPAGVFNVVQGAAEIGQALSTHDDVDGVLFTGSARVGKRLVADCLNRLDRLVALELGGKNVSIALADCDLEQTARAVAFSAYATTGQRCTCTSRLIVHRDVADALCDRISKIARALRVGHPQASDTFMGPLISAESRARLLIAQSRADAGGYQALVAGSVPENCQYRGHYVTPALRLAPPGNPSVPGYTDEELFAPDLAVQVVDDIDEALTLANDTRFGLAAAVFARTRDAFEHAAAGLRVGVVHWNRSTAGASGRLPFGGVGNSGNHRAAGIHGGLCCTFPLSVLLEPAEAGASGTWPGFPSS